jgi:peptide/nickel transport system substrate-binding protein
MTVVPQSRYFEKEFAEAYAQFDLEKANQLMSEIGLEWDEDHEYRLRSDGERLTITLEFRQKEAGVVKLNELVKEDWKEVGVDLRLKLVGGGIVIQRYSENQAQMGLWVGDRSAFLFNVDPLWYVPISYTYAIAWAPLWGKWCATKGKEGEEPAEEVKKNIERWGQFNATMNEEERTRLGKEILRSQAENLWTIGVVGLTPAPVIIRDNLRNVPEEALFGWDYYMTLPWKPSTYFFKSPLYPSQKG